MKFFSVVLLFAVLSLGVSANYLTGTKGGGALSTKGGSPAVQTKGSSSALPTKGSPLKGLLKPSPPKPVYSTSYTAQLRPQSKVEQKIEQQVVQQEEEHPVVQQQLESSAKKPVKVGSTKWEQNIEEPLKTSYKPRTSILKPQVQQIEQQVVQQNEEPVGQFPVSEQLPARQKVRKTPPLSAQKPLPARTYPQPKPKPVRTEQKVVHQENVRQVPTAHFNVDAGWD